MSENKWTATTSTSWIFFDAARTSHTTTGNAGDTITIYIKEATEPTTDVEGVITITANGSTFTKSVKRCVPSVESSESKIKFRVDYGSAGGSTVGPCENGSNSSEGTEGVSIVDIKQETTETYSNGETKTTEKDLSNSDVNIWYILEDGTRYNKLPSNKEKDRQVSVKVALKSDASISGQTDNAFTQAGIKDSSGNIDESKLHNVGYATEPTVSYRSFNIRPANAKSSSCEAGRQTYSVDGEKVTTYGGKTGLTACGELVAFGESREESTAIPINEVTFSVQETQFASFNNTNTLSYLANETRTNDRELHITATHATAGTVTTTYTVVKGNECGSPMYIVLKANKETVDYEGGKVIFTYYLTETEGGSQGTAIKDQDINSCLQFIPPQGVSTGNSSYSNGVYSVEVIFTQNSYKGGEEGITWTFSATCDNASNSPKTLKLYQSSKYESIIPNCDYFIFKYIWTESDGQDLDSLTHLSSCPTLSGDTVGWLGTAPAGTPSVTKVVGTNSKPYLKWGGDNTCNGSEYTIVCLKNIIEDYKSRKIDFENGLMYVDIYANWFSTKNAGYMTIIYNQYTGLTDGGYSEEIKETEHVNECSTLSEKTKYYSFEPVPGKCASIAKDVETRQIKVSASGSFTNASLAKNEYCYECRGVDCIDGPYTHALRLKYNFLSNITSIEYFTDYGIDTRHDTKIISVDGIDYRSTYEYTANTSQNVVRYNNIYLKHTSNGTNHTLYLLENDFDNIKFSEYEGNTDPNKKIYYYTKSDLDAGKTINLSYISNLKITKNTDRTINIEFTMPQATSNREFDMYFNVLTDYLGTCGKLVYYIGSINTYQKVS